MRDTRYLTLQRRSFEHVSTVSEPFGFRHAAFWASAMLSDSDNRAE